MKTRTILAILPTLLLLAGCGTTATESTPQETPQAFDQIISVTGKVVPATWATLSTENGGIVTTISVSRGEQVRTGKVLAQVGKKATYEALLADAENKLTIARQAKKTLEEGAATATADALSALANARKEFEDAEDNLASSAPDLYKGRLLETKDWLDKAQSRYQWLQTHSQDNPAAVQQGYAEYIRALQEYQKAQSEYDQNPTATTHSQIQYDIRKARLEQAKARLADAERQYAKVKNGIDPDLLQKADSALAAAEAARDNARALLDACDIRAPFDGTITAVFARSGEFLAPGQAAFVLGDLSTLQIETTDLDEVDVTRISVRQTATIAFDALPSVSFRGTVESISPMAEGGTGGVNYVAIIRLEETDPSLLWGMTAFIDIKASS